VSGGGDGRGDSAKREGGMKVGRPSRYSASSRAFCKISSF
jgi:hypothetical protein